MAFSIMCLIGGLLCAAGDLLYDFKGKGNVKLGEAKYIDSKWESMSMWRFRLSIILAAVGNVLVGFGIYELSEIIRKSSELLANGVAVCGYVGAAAGWFIHAVCCLQPVVYQSILKKSSFKVAEEVITEFYNSIIIPFAAGYAFIMITALLVMLAVLMGYLNVPMWFALLNPLVFLIISGLLGLIKKSLFYDFPGIIMPSLGLSMYGVIGIVSLM